MESNEKLERMLRQMYEKESLYRDDLDTSDIIDEEWTKFEAKHFPAEGLDEKLKIKDERLTINNSPLDPQGRLPEQEFTIDNSRFHNSSFRKIAAMVAGVLLLSGITYAAIRFVGGRADGEDAGQEQTVVATDGQQTTTDATLALQDSTLTTARVFENQELGSILEEMAQFYDCEVEYRNENARKLRLYFTWDKRETVDDVVGAFNKFERFHIRRDAKRLIVE